MDGGRALVLAGGGVAGIGWEAGMIAGLRAAGVDLTTADLLIGTSAGSVVGSFLGHGVDPADAIERYATGAADAPSEAAKVDLDAMLSAFALLMDESLDPREARVQVGEMALRAPTQGMAARQAEIGRRLPNPEWPDRPLLVTGVDLATGEFVAWDRTSGVPLPLAVAASCAVPCVFPPVEIGGRRFMDGGVRSVTNADLAKGADRVVVLEPMAHISPRKKLARELAELGDARQVAFGPDQAAIEVFGMNMLDNRLWRPAFQAGRAQAATAVDQVKAVWEG
jgi:NTE family protein